VKTTEIVEILDLKILELFPKGSKLFTSLEGENPGGSIKDHMVLHELQDLLQTHKLNQGSTVTEASMGSTARSLAFYCRKFELKCALFIPDFLPAADQDTLKELGAKIYAHPMTTALAKYQEFCETNEVHPFNQLLDVSKRRHYQGIGQKIQDLYGEMDIVLGAVGTGHSLIGISEVFSDTTQLISAEPISGIVPGVRNLDGARHDESDPCRPELFDQRLLTSEGDYFLDSAISTSLGEIEINPSFQLVLGSLKQLSPQVTMPAKIFLVGSANRRSIHPKN
jgi:cysteine synthase